MNANRLLRMMLNRFLRAGAQRMSKGKPVEKNLGRAQKSVRMINRIRRM